MGCLCQPALKQRVLSPISEQITAPLMIMRGILQHRLTGAYLAADGSLTLSEVQAERFVDLASAARRCLEFGRHASDFSYQRHACQTEPEPAPARN